MNPLLVFLYMEDTMNAYELIGEFLQQKVDEFDFHGIMPPLVDYGLDRTVSLKGGLATENIIDIHCIRPVVIVMCKGALWGIKGSVDLREPGAMDELANLIKDVITDWMEGRT
jgi:hypothetical protein